MKKTSKFLSVFLAFLMVISIIPITASAETIEGTWGENITWNFDESTGVLTISGYGEISGTKTWSSYNEDIKEIIIEEGITTIPNSAFSSCRALVSVKLPDSLSLIDEYAFFFCTNLESIFIGIGVKTIGERAFDLCFKLKNVYYSGTKTQWKAISIGQNNSYITSGPAFYYNSVGDSGHAHIYETIVTTPATCTENGLGSVACTICGYSYPTKLTALGHTNVVIPSVLPTTTKPGHTRIEKCSVCDAVITEGTVIPALSNENTFVTRSGDNLIGILDKEAETLTVYGSGTIEYGHNLTVIYDEELGRDVSYSSYADTLIITDGITGIGSGAFGGYPVKTVVIADSVKSIGKEAFYGCELLNSVVVGDGVTSIGDYAFEDCCCLVKVELGESVQTIGKKAFSNCGSLETFDVDENNPYYSTDENGILYNGDKTELIMFPQSNRTANYEMPSSVKEIREDAFYKCKYVVYIRIADGVAYIPADAFNSCESFTTIVIPESVTKVGEYAFDFGCPVYQVYYCGTEEQWNAITIESNNYKLLMSTIYYNYEDLKSGSGACGENLTWTYDADTDVLTISGTGAMAEFDTNSEYPWYEYRNSVKKIVISNGVTSISKEAFEGFTGLKDVEIADTVTTIGEYAFRRCDSLVSVTIPDSVTTIGQRALSGCRNLSSVKLPNNITTISNNMFAGCINLTDITIPDSVTTIEYGAFSNCKNLENITLSENLTTIDSGAFYECYSLKSIDIPDGVTIIKEDTFRYCVYMETVKIGKGVTTIEECAFYNCDSLYNVYYAGGEHDWNLINIGDFNGWLLRGKVHFAEAPGHSYTSEITTPATHTENGVITYTCSCGDSYTEAIEILEKHNYESVVTEPTCTEQGYTTYTCVCGDSYVADYVDATGHNYNAVVTPPTCTEQGYTIYTCECGDTYIRNYVNATGHTEETISAVAPTCTETGLTEGAKCSICGEVFTEQETVPALGHNHTSEITTSATHTTTGVMTYTCACGDTYTETIDKLAEHNHNAVVTPPTCTEQGYTTYTCECGDSYVADYVNKTGHEYYGGDLVTIVPTCTEGGYRYWPCSNCDHIWYFDFVDAKGHWYEETITMPTCTEPGYIYFVCKCGDSFGEALDAFGHTEEIIPAVAPTCTETGLTEGKVCSVCGETLTEQQELSANGHTPASAVEENYVAPACTEQGSKDIVVYCSECDEEISRETEILEATGHADNDGDGYCDADNELLDPTVECECNCHKTGISKFFFNLILFFQKIFDSNNVCDCGVTHY